MTDLTPGNISFVYRTILLDLRALFAIPGTNNILHEVIGANQIPVE